MLADGTERVDKILARAQCVTCHKIAGIPEATGTIGPELWMKTTAPGRLRDNDYKGKAKTIREYVVESIIHPSIYVVKGFPDNTMPKVFGTRLTGLAIDKMADYLSQLEEGKAPPKIN